MILANEQGSQIEVFIVKEMIMHGKFEFLKIWDCILDYYIVLLDKIEYIDTCGLKLRHSILLE